MRESPGLVIGALAGVCVLFCLPYLLPLDRMVVEESYLQFASYLDLNVLHLLRDHRVPLWAHHFGGGYPFIKHPDNISLSPLFYLLVLPFGTSTGLKLLLLSSYAAGAAGFYLLVRQALGYGFLPSVLASLYFLLNPFIPYQINTGNNKVQGWLYLPLIAYLAFRSVRDKRWVFFAACAVALSLLNGMGLELAPMALFLFLFAACRGFSGDGGGARGLALARRLAAILALACAISAIKLLPVLDLLRVNSRAFENYDDASAGAMTFVSLFRAFLSRGPFAVGNEAVAGPNGLGTGFVSYLGPIPCLMVLVSCAAAFKRVRGWVAISALFLALGMAGNFPVDLFHVLWRLPLFRSIHEPARYFGFPAVFLLPLIACAFFSSPAFARLGRGARGLAYAAAFLGAADMFAANAGYYRFAGRMQEPVPELRWDGDFFHARQEAGKGEAARPWPAGDAFWARHRDVDRRRGLQYFLLRQNIGLTNWYGNIGLPENAVPRYLVRTGWGGYWSDLRGDPSERNGVVANAAYRGEAFFAREEANRVVSVERGTDRLEVAVEQARPDTLVVNENYDRDWRSDAGTVVNAGGLLGVALEAPVRGTVRFAYRPASFLAGAVMSALALLLSAVFLLRQTKA